jgi:hypothetical protein
MSNMTRITRPKAIMSPRSKLVRRCFIISYIG